MANRNTLAVHHLEDFKKWLLACGWEILPTQGEYETLRAVREGKRHPLLIYKRLDTNGGSELKHLSVLDRDMPVVRKYYNEKRRNRK